MLGGLDGFGAQCRDLERSFESEPAVVAAILRPIVGYHWKFMR